MKASMFFLLIAVSFSGAQTPIPRQPFTIPLAKLSVAFNESTGDFEKVKISYEGSDDQVIISSFDDQYLKCTRHGINKIQYREPPDRAIFITEFESREIQKVINTLQETLEIFETDLRNEKWEKCVYLDAFLPKFLRGFYFLSCAAQNSTDVLPYEARVPESLFDVSLNSTKSDQRIEYWRTAHDYNVKLRIATKELIYQIKQRQKNKLQENAEELFDQKFSEAYTLFVLVYFNISSKYIQPDSK